MGNIHNFKVIRQCFSYISDENIRLPISDHRVHKLTAITCAKLIIASQLGKWDSYKTISLNLRTSEALQQCLELDSISASQISRRLKAMPTEMFESLFLDLVGRIKEKTPIVCSSIGPLRIVDSTCLKMPDTLASWACLSGNRTQIKIHVRVVALPKGEIIPEKIILSTGNVSDYETMDVLVENDGTIYVMDRGYAKYVQFDKWLDNHVRFVTRINEKHGVLRVEKEFPVPAGTHIIRDAIVQLGSKTTSTKRLLRLVEFLDDEGHKYRLATSCFDLEATAIADLYRQRWLIELYFKWMKQHLRLVKLYSYDPQGVWNQIFLALITYAIVLLIQLESGTALSAWDVLRTLRCCWDKDWSVALQELHPVPSRRSAGRQKKPPKDGELQVTKPNPFPNKVGMMKPGKTKRDKKETKKRKK